MKKYETYRAFADICGVENVKIDEPMSKHTSFKIGGPADILVTPENTKQLKEILELCSRGRLSLFIMGNGSNLLVKDNGIRGVVIKIYDKMKEVIVKNNVIHAQPGVLLSYLANTALANSLKGMEFAGGIPGTLGGAVAMNAGAYGGEMKDIVKDITVIDYKGNVLDIDHSRMEFGYRSSIIQRKDYIITQVRIELHRGDYESIKRQMTEYNKQRLKKQPVSLPSAGSIFKRPDGYYAGKLIENCGLKGFIIGGAQISKLHCGFIVNNGNASAKDVIDLINYIKESVKKKFDVDIETEVKVVGE